jgi:cytochrome c553
MRAVTTVFALALNLAILQTAVSATADEQRIANCLACHGQNGQSTTPEVPSLGGQPEYYVTIQLVMFRDKLRGVEIMNQSMAGVSDDMIRELANFVSKLPPPQAVVEATDEARVDRAKALAQNYHCNVCHQPDFSGYQNVPRLAGQREDYLVHALRGYKDNTRRGYDASMADVIQPVTDAQILDLSYYLARVH